jgi:hypothetical protein
MLYPIKTSCFVSIVLLSYTYTYCSWSIIFIHEKLYKKQEHLDSGGVCVAHLFSFLCSVFCSVCGRPVSCMPNAVSGLSIPFSLMFISKCEFRFVMFQHPSCPSVCSICMTGDTIP